MRRWQKACTGAVAVAFLLAAVFVAGAIDYVLRYHDPGIRLIATLAVVSMAVPSAISRRRSKAP